MSTISFSKGLDGSNIRQRNTASVYHNVENKYDNEQFSIKHDTRSQENILKEPKIAIIGVGGAGCNAINNMIAQGIKGVELYVANTDNQSLAKSICKEENKIQLGSNITNGLGAGSSPEIGQQAAQESVKQIEEAIRGANMVFVTAGMGGGTGTGAAPIIADIARKKGILTIGVVTKPFKFERDRRMQAAENGIAKMNDATDTLIVISNQNVFRIANEQTTLTDAFAKVDDVLFSGIRCITDLITKAGLVNLDFADVASVMSHGGRSVMGEGEADGEDKAVSAAEKAITNPILEVSSVKGAKGILINITGGRDMTLFEVNDAIDRITQEIDPNAILKFGSIIEEGFDGKIRVSVVATGVDEHEIKKIHTQNSSLNVDESYLFTQKHIEKNPSENNKNNAKFGFNQKHDIFHESNIVSNKVIPQKTSSTASEKETFYQRAYGSNNQNAALKNQTQQQYEESSYKKFEERHDKNTSSRFESENTSRLVDGDNTRFVGQNARFSEQSGRFADQNTRFAEQNTRFAEQNDDAFLSQDKESQNFVNNEFKSLSSVKPIGKAIESQKEISRKIVIQDDSEDNDEEFSTKSLENATSFFSKLLKKKR